VNDWIQIVHVQGSRHGGQFAINLGLQPQAVPDLLGNSPDPKAITENLCEFRKRLSESGTDRWWTHDGTSASMDTATAAAAQVYVRIGRPFLAMFSGPGSPIETLTPEDLRRGWHRSIGLATTDIRMAYVLAKLRQTERKYSEARAFADFGLAGIGSASRLRDEFESLRCLGETI
jgi:hypothetical protein